MPAEREGHGPVDEGMLESVAKPKAAHPFNDRAMDALRSRASTRAQDRLRVVNWVEAEFPLINKKAAAFTVQDDASGEQHSVILDENGNEVDDRDLILREKAAYRERYGAMTQRTHKRLENAGKNETFPVMISGFVPVDDTPEESLIDKSEEQAQQIVGERMARHNERVSRVQQKVRSVLDELGFENAPMDGSPAVYAELTRTQLDKIARHDIIQDIDVVEGQFVQRLSTRRGTRYVSTVQNRTLINSTQKVNGAGVNIGVLEVAKNTGGANIFDPLVFGQTLPPPLTGARIFLDQNVTGCQTNDHGARMVGHLVSQNVTAGFSPSSNVHLTGSCTESTLGADYRTRTDWLITQGVTAVSASSGLKRTDTSVVALDRDIDRRVYNSRITFLNSAGNDSTGYIDAPSYGYNVISVGAYDDKGSTSATDAARASFSAWRNPSSTYNDREKPDLGAPGVNISGVTVHKQPNNGCAGACQYFRGGNNGTSDATAFVAGIAGLMMHRDGRLKTQPEAVKAILLTSASERFSGSTEYTGAGGVYADHADNMAQNYVSGLDASAVMNSGAKGGWTVIENFCSKYPVTSTDNSNSVIIKLGNFPGNTDFHYAIAWSVNPDGATYPQSPGADLSVEINRLVPVNGSNSTGVSNARDRNWELGFHVIPYNYAADYRLIVRNRKACSEPNMRVGIAWNVWRP